jgi:tripartite-type tricarboxylate transporter receptor subunit TctC
MRRILAEQGTEPDLRAGEVFAAFMDADRARWRDLITRAGIEPV